MTGARWALAIAVLAIGCSSKKETPAQTAQTAARALEVPRDRVWAASTHLRLVDVAAGQAVAGIQLGRAINDLAFSDDGLRGFVATSAGVYEFAVDDKKLGRQLTTSPARQVLLSPDGRSVGVLEHDVIVAEGGARTPSPFRWKTVSIDDGKVLMEEVAGERVLAVAPGYGARSSVVLFEAGVLMIVPPAQALVKGGEAIDLEGGVASTGRSVPRQFLTMSRDRSKAYFPVEGTPSRVIEVDLVAGKSRAIALGGALHLRGLGLSPDERTLYVTALTSFVAVDLASGRTLGALELGAPHTGVAVAPDHKRAYVAQTIDGNGGAITVIALDPLRVQGKIHLDDLSPWVIGVAPKSAVASR